MGEEYEFVRICESNFSDFASLVKDAFGTEPTLVEIEALFDTGATGKKYIGYIAYGRETRDAAAFYGIFPCFVEYNGQRFLAAQSGSTMTHRNHRKRGLFYEAGMRTFQLARDEGIHFVYGFPNPFSYRGLMKLGWSHDETFNSYHIFVPTLPLAALASKLRFLQPIHRYWFRFVTSRWRVISYPFDNSTKREGVGVVARDDSTLHYKPESEERFMIRTGDNTIWINHQQGRIGIGDIDLPNGSDDFRRTLSFLKLVCFLTGSFHLRTYLSPGSTLDVLFKENGYKARSSVAICHKDLSNELPIADFKYVYADFDTF